MRHPRGDSKRRKVDSRSLEGTRTGASVGNSKSIPQGSGSGQGG